MLSSNPSAKCNGLRPECYKNACAKAMAGCPASANETRLSLARCPDSKFTECWSSNDKSFMCLGRPRPTAADNFEAFCALPGQSRAPAAAAGAASGGSSKSDVVLVPMYGNGAAGRRGVAGAAASLAAGAAALLLLLA